MSDAVQLVWSRRPAKAVARLGGRKLLISSARELLRAAAREDLMLVALAAPALAAGWVYQMELGLEIVPLGGARAAAELARQLRSRGATPSAVRITGLEDEVEGLRAELGEIALTTATESVLETPRRGLRQLVA